jgi:putative Mg2+ transporter-C (MgtC) family protein
MLSHWEMVARMAAGSALGAVIGYERDRHGRPVGLRTHLLVALSASTFMVVSSQFAFYQSFNAAPGIEVDASRIAASVVSAIGFLAGGSILRTGATVQGLTTAAGLWLVTAIGLASGAGMFTESAAATLFGVMALTLLRRFEDKDDNFSKRRLSLVFRAHEEAAVASVVDIIAGLRGKVAEIEYERHFEGDAHAELTVDVSLPREVTLRQLMAALEAQPGLERAHIRSVQ